MSSPVQAVTEEIQGGFAAFDPQNVADLRATFRDLPELFTTLRQALSGVADKCEGELPVHADVVEHLRELMPMLSGMADHAGELLPLFESKHEEDLKRIDDPRPGEEILDVTRQ